LLDLMRGELTDDGCDGLERIPMKHRRELPTALPVRLAVEREHAVLGEHRQDTAVRGPGQIGAGRGVKHLVGEVGSTDNEHPTGHDARQREKPAAGPPSLRERLQWSALKRDGVSQSRNTRVSFQFADWTTGLSREVPVVRTGDREMFAHHALADIRVASSAGAT
jgi:hypothetical protein